MLPYLATILLSLMASVESAKKECSVGDECILVGEIQVSYTPPVPTAILDLGKYCVPLALDSKQLSQYKEENTKVIVKGKALSNYKVPQDVLTYKVEARNLSTMCSSDYILWVLSIEDI